MRNFSLYLGLEKTSLDEKCVSIIQRSPRKYQFVQIVRQSTSDYKITDVLFNRLASDLVHLDIFDIHADIFHDDFIRMISFKKLEVLRYSGAYYDRSFGTAEVKPLNLPNLKSLTLMRCHLKVI